MNVAPASWPAVAWTSRSTLVHDELPIHAGQALVREWRTNPTIRNHAVRNLNADHRAQFLHRLGASLQRGIFVRRELDLDNLFQPPRAQLAGNADVVAFDAVFALQIGRAGQNLLLILENGFGH